MAPLVHQVKTVIQADKVPPALKVLMVHQVFQEKMVPTVKKVPPDKTADLVKMVLRAHQVLLVVVGLVKLVHQEVRVFADQMGIQDVMETGVKMVKMAKTAVVVRTESLVIPDQTANLDDLVNLVNLAIHAKQKLAKMVHPDHPVLRECLALMAKTVKMVPMVNMENAVLQVDAENQEKMAVEVMMESPVNLVDAV